MSLPLGKPLRQEDAQASKERVLRSPFAASRMLDFGKTLNPLSGTRLTLNYSQHGNAVIMSIACTSRTVRSMASTINTLTKPRNSPERTPKPR